MLKEEKCKITLHIRQGLKLLKGSKRKRKQLKNIATKEFI